MGLYRRDEVNQGGRIGRLEKATKPIDYIDGQEQDTRTKWIDGNKIYQQTFSMTNPGIGDIALPHGIDGLDVIVDGAVGYCVLADETKITLPVVNHASSGGSGSGGGSADAANTITLVEWDNTNLIGYIGSNYELTKAVSSLVFTIKYTKV